MDNTFQSKENAWSTRSGHNPLMNCQMRLFSIHLEDEPDTQLRIETAIFTMGNAPPYVALSYVWGQDLDHKTINLDGVNFYVRPNLFTFLKALREFTSCQDQDQDHNYPWFWCDAICINQADVRERNAQVSTMNMIYSTAAETIIWFQGLEAEVLGPLATSWGLEEHDCHKHMEMLRPLITTLLPEFQFLLLPSSVPKVKRRRRRYKGARLCRILDILDILHRLTNHSYFTRIWIVQELHLSRMRLVLSDGHVFQYNVIFDRLTKLLQDLETVIATHG